MNRIQLSEDISSGVIFPFGPGIVVDRVSREVTHMLNNAGIRSKKKANNVKHRLTDSVDSYQLNLNDSEVDIINTIIKYNLLKYIQTSTNNKSLYVDSFTLDHPWINYQQANDFNPSHYHPAAFSYIIYVDIPEIIRSESFEGPPTSMKGVIEFSRNNAQYILKPKTGDFILFPSEIYHTVYPFNNNVTRVSVAGNIHELKIHSK